MSSNDSSCSGLQNIGEDLDGHNFTHYVKLEFPSVH